METIVQDAAMPESDRRYRVLLVDDDLEFRKAHKRILGIPRSPGVCSRFEVVDADGAQAAINFLAQTPVDCVLLDYRMPGGDGLSCLDTIVRTHPDLPVIFLTGAGNEQVAADAFRRGAVDYRTKGALSPESLERIIIHAISSASVEKQIEAQRKQLLDEERLRIMRETIGAACHHLGQPLTILRSYMALLHTLRDVPDEARLMLDRCYEAVERACEVVERMQRTATYSSESYLGNTSHVDILKLNGGGKHENTATG